VESATFIGIIMRPLVLLSGGIYLASLPFYDGLKERLLINAIAVSGAYGIFGTILMGQPGSAVPVNAVLGAIVSVIITVLFHKIQAAWQRMRYTPPS
jgi:hypothetical protein